jgi:hypothetical protein
VATHPARGAAAAAEEEEGCAPGGRDDQLEECRVRGQTTVDREDQKKRERRRNRSSLVNSRAAGSTALLDRDRLRAARFLIFLPRTNGLISHINIRIEINDINHKR